jgi:hypothetical protein
MVWSTLSLTMLYEFFVKHMAEDLTDSFVEFISGLTFTDILRQLKATGNLKTFIFKDDVVALNEAKKAYAGENKTFHDMYLSELGGYLDIFETTFNESMEYLYYKQYGHFPTLVSTLGVDRTAYKKMVYNLCRLKKLSTELPSFRIFPELSASIRWNTSRKYSDGNDTIDFMHAAAALPYFDYFFTERELKTIIRQRKLDNIYSCIVESDPTIILELLYQL